ncbi:MAG TPA: ABC transporter ATP-binding protein [Acidimicrobiales bacterium]|nr:ABC transporter ATP-binding protein [Acidimicrobiales bacterium]
MSSQPTISLTGVTKWFGDVVALNDVTVDIGSGVTALLGPNGAGKSTMLRLLCGLTPPSQGTVRVLGRNPRDEPSLDGRLALVAQQEALPESFNAITFLTHLADLSGVASPKDAATACLERVELDPGLDRKLKTYSKGMRQRVKVAQALLTDPEVLVLDEPLEGLDPRQRLLLIGLFQDLGVEGRTVLVSSHVLEEVERFGSRVVMLAQGRLAAEGDYHDIRDLMDDRPHRIRVTTDKPRELANALVAAGAVSQVSFPNEGTLVCETEAVTVFRTSVVSEARTVGARLTAITPLDDDLESVFRYLVQHR